MGLLLVPIIKINAVLFNFWRKLPNPNVNDFNLSNPRLKAILNFSTCLVSVKLCLTMSPECHNDHTHGTAR